MPQEQSFVYMLRCARGELYTGWTNDPFARLHAHKTGVGAKYTRGFKAKRFAYLEQCETKSAGMQREAAIKKMKKAQKEALCTAWAAQHAITLSLGGVADTAELLEIYTWYVLNHTATFQVTPYTLPEFTDWVQRTLEHAPILLARDANGKLLGYACAHLYHQREAYRWDIETTIYCAPAARGLGVGDMLYPPLLEMMRQEGYYNAYGILADPNPASEAFHARHGFQLEGRSPRAGFKFGKWQGTSTWGLQLKKGRAAPAPIVRLTEAQQLEILAAHAPAAPHAEPL